jgi:hypothetical protein
MRKFPLACVLVSLVAAVTAHATKDSPQTNSTFYSAQVDSTGTLLPWIDATQGTRLVDAQGDDVIGQITWPFDFWMYCDPFHYRAGIDVIDVNSNGSLHFDQGGPRTPGVNCSQIPSTTDGRWLAPLGEDLYSHSVWFIVTGIPGDRVLTIEWVNSTVSTGGTVDLQVNLFEAHPISVLGNGFGTQTRIVAPIMSPTDGVVGIDAGDGVRGQELCCAATTGLPSDDFDVGYRPPPWTSVRPTTWGTVKALYR